MTKPCPLYLKPADVLAAFSGDLDRAAQPAPLARRFDRFRFANVRVKLASPLRRRWRPAAADDAAAHLEATAGDPRAGAFDAPPNRAVAEPRARSLLSHFAMVQVSS